MQTEKALMAYAVQVDDQNCVVTAVLDQHGNLVTDCDCE